jgi:hypothetical protein
MLVNATWRHMTIEMLYFDGCPSHEQLLDHLLRLLEDAGIKTPVTLREIADSDEAERERFLGSPTIRVEGRDIEPGGEERSDYGFKCRVYRTAAGLTGLPPDEWILNALVNRRGTPSL